MFNDYLFNGNQDEKILKKFFKNSKYVVFLFYCFLYFWKLFLLRCVNEQHGIIQISMSYSSCSVFKSNRILIQICLKYTFFRDKGLCIVIDPPFGGRVEPLVQTIKDLSAAYRKVCEGEGLLPVIWAFPYFSEPYIRNIAPEIKMHDYQVCIHSRYWGLGAYPKGWLGHSWQHWPISGSHMIWISFLIYVGSITLFLFTVRHNYD